MNERDREVWRRRQAGESFRHIGRTLGMAGSSVQRCLARAQKRKQEQQIELLAERERAELLAELAADSTDELARYRLRHLPPDDDW